MSGCPICNYKLRVIGKHEKNYKVSCLRGCYSERSVNGRYEIELFERKYVLNDYSEFEIIDNVIEELSKIKGFKRK